MLQLVKGKQKANEEDEGFVSWYMERPKSLFAQFKKTTKFLRDGTNKFGIGDTTPVNLVSHLPNVIPVQIDQYPMFWDNYVFERFGEGRKPKMPPYWVPNQSANGLMAKRKPSYRRMFGTKPSTRTWTASSPKRRASCQRTAERCDAWQRPTNVTSTGL